jgi:bifunctional UDP-N-acetylglucosamine pyrophosphorylase/glucosamine-1-phosphate N-acetyltransferase
MKTDIPATAAQRAAITERHMENGVVVIDPAAVYIGEAAVIAPGAVLYPGVIIEGESIIESGAVIGPNTRLTDARVGKNARVQYSVMERASIGEETAVGPFAYLRPAAEVGSHCKIGDFVEVKNAKIGDYTKASHLTYIGDTDTGENVNFGCGTVTVNYNGKVKHRTHIGDNAFIGCNSNLVAPVTVGADAYIAAGSTITRDVPPGTLAIARERQVIKDNWKLQ